MPRDEFDVYKLAVQDTNDLNRRRQALDALYVTLITLILTGDGYIALTSPLDNWLPTIVTVIIGVFGFIVTRYYRQGLSDLREALRVRYEFLRELETLGILSSIHASVITREWDQVFKRRRNRSTTRGLSLIFIVAFILVPVVVALLTAIYFIPGAYDTVSPIIRPLVPQTFPTPTPFPTSTP